MMDHERFDFSPVTLQSGITLPRVQIAFKTYGTLNAAKSNAILFPTWFGGQHPMNEWIIGPDRALDPTKYFIIVVNIFGNGMSSSPSSMPAPFDGPRFPLFSILDNVVLQRRLLLEHFGIDRLVLVVGRSMGAQLAFQWGAYYPDRVDRILPFVGSAKTAVHNYIFLENVRMAITSDPAWNAGEYSEPPVTALRRMRLIFDSWGLSQSFYRANLHLKMGFDSTDAYLNRPMTQPYADANDALAQVRTWQNADISANDLYKGNFGAALGAISAKAIVMPSATDLYFPPEDSEYEVARMPNAELRVIPSVWGHRAGAPGTDPKDTQFIDDAIRDLLAC